MAIIGGRFKGGDLRELREPLCGARPGGRGDRRGGAAGARGADGVVPVVEAASMREAVERGYEAAAPDGVVLLAPACASFDWFRDYAERGRVFKDGSAQVEAKVRRVTAVATVRER